MFDLFFFFLFSFWFVRFPSFLIVALLGQSYKDIDNNKFIQVRMVYGMCSEYCGMCFAYYKLLFFCCWKWMMGQHSALVVASLGIRMNFVVCLFMVMVEQHTAIRNSVVSRLLSICANDIDRC